MRVTVRFFAVLRDRAQMSETTLDLRDGATVATARDEVSSRLPELRELLPRVAFAVNREYVSAETKLHENDELALIPPVSGG